LAHAAFAGVEFPTPGVDQAAWPAAPSPGKQPSTMRIANSV